MCVEAVYKSDRMEMCECIIMQYKLWGGAVYIHML